MCGDWLITCLLLYWSNSNLYDVISILSSATSSVISCTLSCCTMSNLNHLYMILGFSLLYVFWQQQVQKQTLFYYKCTLSDLIISHLTTCHLYLTSLMMNHATPKYLIYLWKTHFHFLLWGLTTYVELHY